MRARMYDPRIGRILQSDPIFERRPSKHYLYASNNPVSRIDPWGRQDEEPSEKYSLLDKIRGSLRHILKEVDKVPSLNLWKLALLREAHA
jgi:hypothetical protein